MNMQKWVDQLAECPDVKEPPVLGGGQNQLAMDAKDAWTLRYIATMIEAGLPMHFALELYRNAEEHDYSEDPAVAALNEMSYLDDDGDPA